MRGIGKNDSDLFLDIAQEEEEVLHSSPRMPNTVSSMHNTIKRQSASKSISNTFKRIKNKL